MDPEIEELRAAADQLGAAAKRSIRDRYMADDRRPWIVGFSGGKDSTLVSQLVFEAVLTVPPRQRTRKIHVLSSDTLVETPYIAEFVKSTHALMKDAAIALELPVETTLVTPRLNDTFWVRMIGYGYPPPSRLMRWCTDRLKIYPANKFVLEKVSQHGEVLVLLGMRYDESQTRARSLRKYERDDGFHRNASLANSLVWAPIRHFSAEQVWAYLIFNPSPWGGDNKALRDLYKSANAGECPLVVDETTEPCGNSRFGCYVCTVVERDKSMEGFIAAGRNEYKELLELRNWLASLRDDPKCRETRRRNGEPGLGPLTLDVRRMILERLMRIQENLEMELVTPSEVAVIRQTWLAETLESSSTSLVAATN